VKQGAIWRGEQVIVPQAWCADRAWSRLRGLLARPPLLGPATQALWLVPCGSIHTMGMRYALDIVFLDRKGHVLSWSESVLPWRVRQCRGATQTVELAPASLAQIDPRQGEVWQWRSA